jgi:hypothetical protein
MSLKKRALQIGLSRDIDGPMKNTNGVGLHLTLPAASINYYKQVEACSDYVGTSTELKLSVIYTSGSNFVR